MRIVLDLQGAQSDSRFRGIGRYSLALAQAVAREAGQHEVWLALSSRFPEAVEPLRKDFAGLIPEERIRVFELPGPVAELEPANAWRAQAAELIRENFLADLRPDVVHVSTLFEGFHNEVVASIGRLNAAVPTAVTLYDLIPLLNPEKYLPDPTFRRIYLRRAQSLKRADLLLAISESSRQEAVEALQIPAGRIVNIAAGVSPIFSKVEVSPETRAALMATFGLRRPFLLYAGGLEPRKNLEGLLDAYALLPKTLRDTCQLAAIGKLHEVEARRLASLKRAHGLLEDEVVSIGYASDEQLRLLYNTCVAFVFPSLHEGFGLPAVEAMACGAPVIGSNATSIPEIINRRDALFDPRQPQDVADRLAQILTDAKLRQSLSAWGLERAQMFTWEASARTALKAFEALAEQREQRPTQRAPRRAGTAERPRPRLAFISPLPPVQSGIAGYSARLLPHLARHYEITCIVDQAEVADPWVTAEFAVRDLQWFNANADGFERVLYQFGNSPAHKHMFDLLTRHPGVVTLHDFYLSSALNWMEETGYGSGSFVQAAYESHGFSSLWRLNEKRAEVVKACPSNAKVLRESIGVIVHSKHSIELARQFYGLQAATRLRQVDFLPFAPETVGRKAARERLRLPEDAFLVCSFGWVAPVKLNDRLVEAWLQSPLAADPRCRLCFVGSNDGGEYGRRLLDRIERNGIGSRITITGYVEESRYRDYLAAADVAVQLRTGSRGETSAAVFDCLDRGVPLIINAHGSAAELPDDVAIKLEDEFTDDQLAAALVRLQTNPKLRQDLSAKGRLYLQQSHHPERVAELYCEAIEGFYADSPVARELELVDAIARTPAPVAPTESDLASAAVSVAVNRGRFRLAQILVDVTNVARSDLRTGIERVTRGILMALIADPPAGYRIEPVRATAAGYLYARNFACECLGLPKVLSDDPIEAGRGDFFIGVDWCADVLPSLQTWFLQQRLRGLQSVFVVHDVLPLLHPEFFPEVISPMTVNWIKTITEAADGVVCVSRTVADELYGWLVKSGLRRLQPLGLGFSHHGADLRASFPTRGLPADALEILAKVRSRPSFLMVGTVEPRKGHRHAVDAMERLWADGVDAALVIVGKQGWMIEDLAEKVRQHPENNRRLFWLAGASDEMLENIYQNASALLAASRGEGFGLPLIEAAHYGLPIIARDIPVFREVAGEHAYYFKGDDPQDLADALRNWLSLGDKVPTSKGIGWLTWQESSRRLLDVVLNHRWYKVWPDATNA